MKKVFSFFFALTFALSVSVFAQSVTLGTEMGPSPVDIPVTFNLNGNVITALDLTIDVVTPGVVTGASFFAADAVSFNVLPAVSLAGNQITVTWDGGTQQISEPTDGVLFYLRLTGFVGSSDLEFISENEPGENEWLTTGAVPVTSTFVDGEVEFTAPVPLANWAIFIGLGLIIAFVVVRFRRLV